MTDNVTEIFTTVKNCEQQFPYEKGIYVLVHKNGIVTILEIPMDVHIYISKTFYNYLEKQGKLTFSHHFCNYATYNSSMKSNVLNYTLSRMPFPKRLIELGTTATYEKFSQITVAGNQRLLDLLSSKQGELYATTYFY